MVIDMAEVEVPSLMSISEEVWTWVLRARKRVRQRRQGGSSGTRDGHCVLEVGGLEDAWAEKWSPRMSSETKGTRGQPLLLAFPHPQRN